MQDNPESYPAKAGSGDGTQTEARRDLVRARAQVALLGANLWWIAAVWPTIVTDALRGKDALWLTASGLSLLGGVAAMGRRPLVSRATLLVGVPATLAAAVAVHSGVGSSEVYSAPASVLLMLSLLGYGAGVLHHTGPHAPALEARHVPLPPAQAPVAAVPRRIHSAIVWFGAVAAVTVGIVAPLWGGRAALEAAWGEAASEGGVLTAVVAGGLSVSVLGVFLGNALRAPAEPRRPAADPAARVASYLLLALLGAATYIVVGGE